MGLKITKIPLPAMKFPNEENKKKQNKKITGALVSKMSKNTSHIKCVANAQTHSTQTQHSIMMLTRILYMQGKSTKPLSCLEHLIKLSSAAAVVRACSALQSNGH